MMVMMSVSRSPGECVCVGAPSSSHRVALPPHPRRPAALRRTADLQVGPTTTTVTTKNTTVTINNTTMTINNPTVKPGTHCTIWASFWPDFWAARLNLESGRCSASSGVVCRAVQRTGGEREPRSGPIRSVPVWSAGLWWPSSGSCTVEAEPWVDSPQISAFFLTAPTWSGKQSVWKLHGNFDFTSETIYL